MAVDGLKLDVYDADQAKAILEDLVAVYIEIYDEPADAFHGEDRYRRQINGHMTLPGWKLVTGTAGNELVGYAYGFPLSSDRWWAGLLTPVPAGFTEEDGQRTFAISELMVRESWRRQGVARALHDALLGNREESRATLLADPKNVPAQAAYASWGWRTVAQLRPNWDNSPTYDVLILPQRE
ncbi:MULTISPECIES: GNAT family N-acetyltransferase [unclassified Micromonospora]|uniref:GNAT family N-acetyltransferase n=1 Tax=unclassified Micromonospora TaxID=2617518 RepID=UPI003A85304E